MDSLLLDLSKAQKNSWLWPSCAANVKAVHASAGAGEGCVSLDDIKGPSASILLKCIGGGCPIRFDFGLSSVSKQKPSNPFVSCILVVFVLEWIYTKHITDRAMLEMTAIRPQKYAT